MKIKNKILLLALVLNLSGLSAQQTDGKRLIPCRLHLPDSTAWQVQIDDSSFVVRKQSSIAVPCGRRFLGLFRLNDHRWQQFYFADSVVFPLADSALRQLHVWPYMELAHPNFPVAIFKLSPSGDKKYAWSFLRKNNRKPAFIVTAVAANWLSFYLKRRADDYYHQYRQASNNKDLRRYYNASVDFDNYSAISLGLSAAALSIFLYYLLWE